MTGEHPAHDGPVDDAQGSPRRIAGSSARRGAGGWGPIAWLRRRQERANADLLRRARIEGALITARQMRRAGRLDEARAIHDGIRAEFGEVQP